MLAEAMIESVGTWFSNVVLVFSNNVLGLVRNVDVDVDDSLHVPHVLVDDRAVDGLASPREERQREEPE